MRSIAKFIPAFFLITAVCSFASAWDESPIAPKQEQPKQTSPSSIENGAGDGSAPVAVRQENVLVDPRDKQSYSIEEYRGNIWMSQNLNFYAGESYCYENKKENCEKAGRLYTWKVAMEVCPDGWRLPTALELGTYLQNRGGHKTFPSGFRKFNGDFYEFGRNAYFWTSDIDPDYKDYAIYWSSSFNGWGKKGFYKDQAHAVRCIKGENPSKVKLYRSNSKASAFDRF